MITDLDTDVSMGSAGCLQDRQEACDNKLVSPEIKVTLCKLV